MEEKGIGVGLELKFIQIAVKFEQLSFALAAINNMYIDSLVVSEKFNFSKNCMCHGVMNTF